LISAGAPPQTLLGKLTALPQIPWLDSSGPTSKGRKGKREKGEDKRVKKGRERVEKGKENGRGRKRGERIRVGGRLPSGA